jgi:glycosyltransferase involved in cell wall biosynthesis
MEDIRLSVCVVTYNHKDYIRQCLDGILMQKTTFPFEIILGEDESTDGTREICKAYAEKFPEKIKLFLRSRKEVIYINGNPTGRHNFIENLKVAKGKYIALCEGDDYWTDPNKLQKQVDYLEVNSALNICFTKAQILRSDGSMEPYPIPEEINTIVPFKNLLTHHNFIATASVVFRNARDLRYPDWFTKIPFGDLSLYKLITENSGLGFLEDTTVVYRAQGQGVYSRLSTIKKKINYLLFYSYIFQILNDEEKAIIHKKRNKILKSLSKIKYPNSQWLQRWERWRLDRKYKILP